jgi:hypothetical protein
MKRLQSLVPNSGKSHRFNRNKHKHGLHAQSTPHQTGVDSLTGNATVSTTGSDSLTQFNSPIVASGVQGRPDVFTYQSLKSSTPFDISNFSYSDGDRIQLPGAVEDVWRQYSIQYQNTSDGVVSQVMHGNQLVGVVHAQIGITSLI